MSSTACLGVTGRPQANPAATSRSLTSVLPVSPPRLPSSAHCPHPCPPAEQRQAHGGPLPLSPGSTLSWLGFSEEGLLAAYDSAGELRLRSELFGGAWVTAFSAAAGEQSTVQEWGGRWQLVQPRC